MSNYNGRITELRETYPIMFRVSAETFMEAAKWLKGMRIPVETSFIFENVLVMVVVDDWYSRNKFWIMFSEKDRNQAILFRLKYDCEKVDAG